MAIRISTSSQSTFFDASLGTMQASRRLTKLLLVVTASIFATSCAIATESDRDEFSSVVGGSDNRRILLRGAAEAGADNEDRGLFSWARLQYWLETGTSKSDVKKALGLAGLEDDALKAAPNFIYYEDFVYARRGRILENWLDNGITTQRVWRHYGLPVDDIPAALKGTDNYKNFMRYAKMEDDKIFNLKNSDKKVTIERGGSPAEMEAKLDTWVLAKRPNWYVKYMLDLDHRARNAYLNSKYYRYYEKFLERTGQKVPAVPLVDV
ncbi:hypothetical protein PR003_g29399 [Phytophthora rubi]|uniref:RxLR effector protein n=1 Tax=Phytophthora rubi TaxID=129364 RepID=A0A6A4BJF8_9STRA|nr:hypothetical protein PR002_g28331 [Phytophthora rubi]KAE8966855.1 hypothetical protein PR001_g28272 [Phytophthora rubi]KAE9275207.1 hypothetical protein PR003_g29399 [Phytophthora rubi]